MTDVVLYGRPINFAVVKLRERQFPGVVVQGDTLNSLVKELELAASGIRAGNDLDAHTDSLALILDQLRDARRYYQAVCSANGLDLPY